MLFCDLPVKEHLLFLIRGGGRSVLNSDMREHDMDYKLINWFLE